MNHLESLRSKIHSLSDLKIKVREWKNNQEKIVFTNGCFDLVHRGHIEVLAKMADLGDKLIVAVNTDDSIQLLKGENRPIIDELSRAILLSALNYVDAVIFFSDLTPLNLIKELSPDILSKGGDYHAADVVGNDIVMNNGGKVVLVPLTDGFSTTNILEKIGKQ